MTLAISLLIYLPKVLIGFIITHLFWKAIDLPSLFIKLAVSVPLGLAVSASVFFLAMMLGVSPEVYSQAELALTLLLIVAVIPYATAVTKQIWRDIKISRQEIIGGCIVLGGYGIFATAFHLYAGMHPHGFEDAWSMWNFVARFIYRSNSPAILVDSSFYNRFHPDYPIGLNLNVAWGWFILRRETTQIPIALALLSVSTPAIVIWATLWKWKNILAGTMGALFIILTLNLPMIIGQYADALLVSHMISAIVLLYTYLKSPKENNSLLVLTGLLAGFSAWIKNEGMIFTGILISVYLLAGWKQVVKRDTVKWLAIGLLFPAGVVLAYKLTVTTQNDLFSNGNSSLLQILDPTRWTVIAGSFLDYFLSFGNWPVSAIAVLGLYAVFSGWSREEFKNQMWIFLIASGQLIGYFFIYLITPHDLQLHIHTSMDRLVAHIFPMVVFWVFAAFHPPGLSITANNGKQ